MIAIFIISALFLPFFSLFLGVVGLSINYSRWRAYIVLVAIFVFSAAYCYEPASDSDLIRYFQMLSDIKNVSLADANIYFDDGLIVKNAFFWLISKLGVPRILPSITTTTVYLISMYITCDYCEERRCLSCIRYIIIFQFFFIPLITIVNNVRNIFAFSIFLLAVYLDLIKKKRNIFIYSLYILPCFIHTTVVLLLILRIISLFGNKIKVAACAIIFVLPNLINVSYEFRNLFGAYGNVGNIIRLNIVKAYWFFNGANDNEWAIMVSKSPSLKINRFIVFSTAILLMLFILTVFKKKQPSVIHTFIFMVCLLVLACGNFTANHYWRFATVFTVLISIIFVPIVDNWRSQHLWVKLGIYFLYLTGFVNKLIMVRFDFRGINVLDYFGNISICGFFPIFLEVLKAFV